MFDWNGLLTRCCGVQPNLTEPNRALALRLLRTNPCATSSSSNGFLSIRTVCNGFLARLTRVQRFDARSIQMVRICLIHWSFCLPRITRVTVSYLHITLCLIVACGLSHGLSVIPIPTHRFLTRIIPYPTFCPLPAADNPCCGICFGL